MEIRSFRTSSANYKIYCNTIDPKQPYSVFIHGGPGFNAYGERHVLGPLFHEKLNFLWFDTLGCAESPAHSPEQITWDNQIKDISEIIREVAKKPVHLIGHCLGALHTHDLVRENPEWI